MLDLLQDDIDLLSETGLRIISRMKSLIRTALTLAVLLTLFSGVRVSGAELAVAAAASLAEVMTEIGARYEKEHAGDRVRFNFGASSMLARQIEQGAPADVFLSADEAKMDALEKQGLLLEGTRRRLLTNSLVIIVREDATDVPRSAAALAGLEFKKIALAEPATVPAGIYARAYLEEMGLWEKLKGKIVPTENVRAALAAVEAGNVEAGFVYKTDALLSRKVRVAMEIPASEGRKISYSVAILKDSKAPEADRKFAEYLHGPSAQAVFQKFGFQTMLSGAMAAQEKE